MDEQKNSNFLSNVLFLLFLIVIGYILFNFIGGKKYINTIEKFTNKPSKSENVLFLGVDSSNNLTDTIIVINRNPATSKTSFLSIPRDTQVIINGSPHKINSVYAMYGNDAAGAATATDTISKLLNLKIENYILINTSSFKKIIDILGGVDYNVPCDLKYDDPYQNLHINLKKGFQHLDGNKAEQLLRFRKPEDGNYTGLTGYYDGSDLKRIDMQQDFIRELIKQKATFKNATELKPIIDELSKNSKTSLSFTSILNILANIALSSDSLKSENIKMFKLNGTTQEINGSSYFIYNDEILDKSENKARPVSEIINTFFVLNYLPE